MNTDLERLSALMDGELEEAEANRALAGILKDEALRAQWGRYHLMGDALRGALPRQLAPRAAAIHATLAAEPTVLCPRPRLEPKRLSQSLLAMAASVVAVVLPAFFWYLHQGTPAEAPAVAVAAPEQVTAPPLAPAPVVTGPTAPAANPAVANPTTGMADVAWHPAEETAAAAPLPAKQRMNGYLVNHNEHRNAYRSVGTPGMLPYVRLVGSGNGH
jgi:sigma-E factor negative regulatory protein RseA